MIIRLSEVQKKTGAELIYSGIVGQNLGRHLLFCSQTPPHNAVRDQFGTSIFKKLRKGEFKCKDKTVHFDRIKGLIVQLRVWPKDLTLTSCVILHI